MPLYGNSEAVALERMVLDYLLRKAAAPDDPKARWSAETQAAAEQIRSALIQGRPIQYVLQESWFDQRAFYVNESVLIPRPETEELLDWIKKDSLLHPSPQQILEIGTGSGILAISLKKAFPKSTVHAVDIEEQALAIAQHNAQTFQEEVIFHQLDFTDKKSWDQLSFSDLLVSNPPYIPLSEKETLAPHVVDHEPHRALFVPTEDPLLFYRLIAEFAKEKLSTQGRIYVELNAERATETRSLFEQMGYQTMIKKDMQGEDRMLRAIRNT